MLVTQAHVVLCFAVAALCCFLEVGKGRRVVSILHVLCSCKKALDINTASSGNFPTSSARYPQTPSFLFCAAHFAYISILQIFHWVAIHTGGFCPPPHHPPLGNSILTSLWQQPSSWCCQSMCLLSSQPMRPSLRNLTFDLVVAGETTAFAGLF